MIFWLPHNSVLKYYSLFCDDFLKIANSIIGDKQNQIIDKFKVVFSDLNCPENSWITSGIFVLASIAIFSAGRRKFL
jgi:hypothetical protein